jgi:hypothetical protein
VEIQDAYGNWVDYSDYIDMDLLDSVELTQSQDERIMQATVEVARGEPDGSLSPLINSDIDLGRGLRVYGARTAQDVAPPTPVAGQEVVASEDAYVGSVAAFTCDSWANLRAGIALNLNFSRTATYLECWIARDASCAAGGNFTALWRSMVAFPTTAFNPALEASEDSFVRLHAVLSPQVSIAGQYVVLVKCEPTDPAAMAYGDWANITGAVAYSLPVPLADILNGSDPVFTLTAAGAAALTDAIAAQTPFCVAVLMVSDAGNAEPAVDPTGTVNARTRFASVEHATPAYRPVLSVTGSVPPEVGDWKLLFDGRVDRWEAAQDPIRLTGRDMAGVLVDRWIEERRVYGSDLGTPIEDVMQEILDDWADYEFTLYVPAGSGILSTPFVIFDDGSAEQESVWGALNSLADRIGYVLEYRWDPGTSMFRLTLMEPERTVTVPQWTFGPDDYYDLTKLDAELLQVRNVWSGTYRDVVSGLREHIERVSQDSIDRFGARLWAEIEEGDDSPIDTAAEMTAMLDAALADTAWPDADHEIEVDLFWPVQLMDFYRHSPNAVHYDAAQDFAVAAFSHSFQNGQATTRILTRGKPAGRPRSWRRLAALARDPAREIKSISLTALPVVDGFGNAAFNIGVDYQIEAKVASLRVTFDFDAGGLIAGTNPIDVTGDGRHLLNTGLFPFGPWNVPPDATDIHVTVTPYTVPVAAQAANFAGRPVYRELENLADTGSVGARFRDYDGDLAGPAATIGANLTLGTDVDGCPEVALNPALEGVLGHNGADAGSKNSAWAWDANDGNIQRVTLGASLTITPTNFPESYYAPCMLVIGYAGAYAPTLVGVDWGLAGEPAWSSDADKIDLVWVLRVGDSYSGTASIGHAAPS